MYYGEAPQICVPSLTYQYTEEGQIDNSHGGSSLRFDETVRERFKDLTISRFADRPGTWDRLCFLVGDTLKALPDNEFTIESAWLCGLVEDGGPRVAGCYKSLAKYRAALAEDEAKKRALEQERAELEAELSFRVLRKEQHFANVEITSKSTGEKLQFDCRNVFDVGYVVNPLYPIAPGRKAGGIANGGQWMQYEGGAIGWVNVRPLTEVETKAIRYLGKFAPISTALRM